MAFSKSVTITVDASKANRSLTALAKRFDTLEASSKKLSESLSGVKQSAASLGDLDRLTDIDKLTKSIAGLDSSIGKLTKSTDSLKKSFQDAGKSSNTFGNNASGAAKKVRGLDDAAKAAEKRMKGIKNVSLSAGLQLQDVAVQAQAGTNALVILGQQGSQFLSSFGLFGAAAGAVLAIGSALGTTLAPALLDTTTATETLSNALDQLDGIIEEADNGVVSFTEDIRKLAEESSEAAQLKIQLDIIDLENQLETARSKIDETLEDLTRGQFTGNLFNVADIISEQEAASLSSTINQLAEEGRTLQDALDFGKSTGIVQSQFLQLNQAINDLRENFGLSAESAQSFILAFDAANVDQTKESYIALASELTQLVQSTQGLDTVSESTRKGLIEFTQELFNQAQQLGIAEERVQKLKDALSDGFGQSGDTAETNKALADQVEFYKQLESAGFSASKTQAVLNALNKAGLDPLENINSETAKQAALLFDTIKAQKDAESAEKKRTSELLRQEKAQEKLNKRALGYVDSLTAEREAIEAGEEELQLYKETKSAIAAIEKSNLDDKELLIALVKEEAQAIIDAEKAIKEKEKADKAAEKQAEKSRKQYEKTYNELRDGVTDAILNFESLEDTLDNLIKKLAEVALQEFIVPQLLGAAGFSAPTTAQAGFAGGAGSLVQDAALSKGLELALAPATTAITAAATTFATSATGVGLGLSTGLSGAALAELGLTTGVAAGGSLTAAGSLFAGAAAPLAITGIGLLAAPLLGSLFGGKPSDKTQSFGLDLATGSQFATESFTGDKFSQQARDIADAAGQQATIFAQALSAETGKELEDQVAFIAGERDGLRIQVNGVITDTTDSAAKFLDLADETLADLFGINSEFYTKLKNEGEQLSSAFIRVEQQFDAVNDIAEKLNITFEAVGEQGKEAANVFTQYAGSLDVLLANSQLYYDNFFSAEERAEDVRNAALQSIQDFNDDFGLVGESFIDSKEELREFIEAQDLSTNAGAKATEAALATANAILQFESATEQLGASIDTARQDYIDALFAERDALSDTSDQFRQFAATLRETQRDLRVDASISALSPENLLRELETEFASVSARAAMGDEEAVQRLPELSRELLTASKDFYGQSEGFYEDFDMVQMALDAAASTAERHVNIDQQQLDVLNAQLTALGAIGDGITNLASLVSQQAANTLGQAVAGSAGQGATASSSDLTDAVSALYTSGLGREPDQAGLDFWVNQLQQPGVTYDQVKAGFFAAANENNEPIQNRFATGGLVIGAGTGTSDSINARLSNREFVMTASATSGNEQFLTEFNQSNGSNIQRAAEMQAEISANGFQQVVNVLNRLDARLSDIEQQGRDGNVNNRGNRAA